MSSPRKKIFNALNPESAKESSLKAKFKFDFSYSIVPHPDKVWKGGQDAAYVSDHALIVADGVSGWSAMGIDAGLYSKKLVENAK